MTIGIAATGGHSGRAVCEALAFAERLGSGEIRGFVALAAVTADGRLLRCETQRGGIEAALRPARESGTAEAILGAPLAALMSSGPDRPTPLARFVPGDAGVGLVTGHRRPDLPGPDGRAINEAALDLLRRGAAPDDAVREALASMPEIDAGLLAVTPDGLAAADSRRAARRDDRGTAIRRAQDGRAFGVVHNSIVPVSGFAEVIAGVGFDRLAVEDGGALSLRLLHGTPIERGEMDTVEIDENDTITRITSSNPHLTGGRRWTSAAVYRGSEIRRAMRRIGRTTGECRALIDGDRVVEVAPPALVPGVRDGDT